MSIITRVTSVFKKKDTSPTTSNVRTANVATSSGKTSGYITTGGGSNVMTILTPTGGQSTTPTQLAGNVFPPGSRPTGGGRSSNPPDVYDNVPRESPRKTTGDLEIVNVRPSESYGEVIQRRNTERFLRSLSPQDRSDVIKTAVRKKKEENMVALGIFPNEVELPTQTQSFGFSPTSSVVDIGFEEGTVSPYKMSFGFAAKETAKDILSLFKPPTGEKTSFTNIGKSFGTTSPAKFETTAYSYYPSGTIGTNQPALKEVTFGDIQVQREVSRNVLLSPQISQSNKEIENYFRGLQKGIYTEDISYNEAEKKGQDFISLKQGELDKSFQDVYKKYPDVGGLGTRQNVFQEGVKLAAFTNPLTSFGAAAISSKQEPLKIDIEAVTSGRTSIEGATTSRPGLTSATTAYLTGGALIGVGGGLGRYKALERSIVAEDIAIGVEQLSQQPFKYGQVILDEGKVGKAFLKGTRGTGNIRQEITLYGDLVKKGGRETIMPRGLANVNTIGKLDWNIIGGTRPNLFISSGKFEVGGKGVSLLRGNGFSISVGKSVITPRFQTSAIFQVPRTSRQAFKTGDIIGKQWARNIQFGGETTIGADYPFVSIKVGKNNYLGFLPKQGGRELREVGVTKIIKSKRAEESLGFRVIGGKKTPFSKTFTEQVPISQTSLTSSINRQTKRIVSSLTKPTSFENSLKGIPRMVGGAGGVVPKLYPVGRTTFNSITPVKYPPLVRDVLVPSNYFGAGSPSLQPLGSKLFEGEKTISRGGFVISPKVFTGGREEIKYGIPQSQALELSSAQKLRTKQTHQYFFDDFVPRGFNPKPIIKPPTGGFRAFPIIPFIPGFDIPKTRGYHRKGGRSYTYQPSLAAIALDLKSFEVPTGYWTGLVTRTKVVKKKRKGGRKR